MGSSNYINRSTRNLGAQIDIIDMSHRLILGGSLKGAFLRNATFVYLLRFYIFRAFRASLTFASGSNRELRKPLGV